MIPEGETIRTRWFDVSEIRKPPPDSAETPIGWPI